MALSTEEYLLYPVYSYPNCFGGDWPETVYTMGETLAPLTATNAIGTYPVTLAFASHALWKYENVWVTGVGGGVDGSRQVLQVLSGTQVTIDAVGSGHYFGSDSGVDVAPHDMTGNSTPSPYAVTTSGSYFGTPWKYFDGDNTTTDPLSFSGSCWVKIDLGSASANPVLAYRIVADNYSSQSRVPKNWTLQGSNNNSTWYTVDTNESDWLGSLRDATVHMRRLLDSLSLLSGCRYREQRRRFLLRVHGTLSLYQPPCGHNGDRHPDR